MATLSTSTGPEAWSNSGWTISSGRGVVSVDVPPPQTVENLVAEPFPLEELASEYLEVFEDEDYEELLEDIGIARALEEDRRTHGPDYYMPYSEYRKQRLGRVD